MQNNIAEVKRLNVSQTYRGYGFGDKLFRHAINHAIQPKYDIVRLDTIRNPGPVPRLFEKYGFVEIPRYNENPNADLFMELDLQKVDKDQFMLDR